MVEIRDKKYPSRHVWVKDHYVDFKNHIADVDPGDAVELIKKDDFEMLSEFACDFNPETWKNGRRKLFFESNADTFSGFGTVSINIVKALGRNGVEVYFGGEQFDEQKFPDLEFDKYKKKTTPDCIMLQFRQPGQFRRNMTERMFGYTPWETTKIPFSWLKPMNKMEVMFTTCEQNAQCFKESGVRVPVYVYHHGIDPNLYPYLERPEDPVWVFGTFGRLSYRKGTDLVVKAFQEAFKGIRDVMLVLKSSDVVMPFKINDDPRIVLQGEIKDHAGMLDLLRMMDVFLFPSRGEGFGLPGAEAMATGLPTIMTNWGGLADYGSKKDTMMLDYTMSHAENFRTIYKEDCGEWAEPNLEQLKEYMRWTYEHKKEAREMGKRASQRIHKDWTWDGVTKKFIKQMDKIV